MAAGLAEQSFERNADRKYKILFFKTSRGVLETAGVTLSPEVKHILTFKEHSEKQEISSVMRSKEFKNN